MHSGDEESLALKLRFDEKGLIPAIAQDFETKDVLMLAYMNKLAFEKTLETGEMHYWSRSNQRLWHKGETSGHFQKVKQIFVDCDQDALIFFIEQIGGKACHTNRKSCFYREIVENKQLSFVGDTNI